MNSSWYDRWRDGVREIDDLQVFFVVGCQKSGTTWVQRLLDGHPEVCCGGESHLLDLLAPSAESLWNEYNRRQQQRSREGRATPLDETDLLGLLRVLGNVALAHAARRRADDAPPLRAIGDKTPEHALGLPVLDRLYPEARFVHVIRDGRDAAVSGWAHLGRQGRSGSFDGLPAYVAYFARHHWRPYILAARAAAAGLGDRYFEVRYEELQRHPVETVRRMLGFLGVAADELALSRCLAAGSFVRLSGGRRPGEEDPGSFFRRGVIGDWVEHFDDACCAAFEEAAGDLLRELGYGPEAAAA
ncbi:MAG: sulfotransferase family protein [Planctomycetota bacterium]|jgi:hypothetical protein